LFLPNSRLPISFSRRVSQLSLQNLNRITLLPNVQDRQIIEKRIAFLDYLPPKTIVWFDDLAFSRDRIALEFEKAKDTFHRFSEETDQLPPEDLFVNGDFFLDRVKGFKTIEFGTSRYFKNSPVIQFNQSPQRVFNKTLGCSFTILAKKRKPDLPTSSCRIIPNKPNASTPFLKTYKPAILKPGKLILNPSM